jgi:glycosyltransferase involved in cell wall biosynthesis
VLDRWRGLKVNVPDGVRHLICPFSWRLPFEGWAVFRIVFSSFGPVVIHTSDVRGLVRAVPALLMRRKTYVFLHHGSVVDEGQSSVLNLVLRYVLPRLTKAIVVGQRQFDMLSRSGFCTKNVAIIQPFIAPPSSFPRLMALSERRRVVVASGYVQRYYNYEFAIKLAQSSDWDECRLYFYGQAHDAAYLAELRSKDVGRKVRIFFDTDHEEFLQSVGECQLLVRANLVDSFGIATWEALSLGTAVVASDVCDRAPGVFTFSAGSYEEFLLAVDNALQGGCVRFDPREAVTRNRLSLKKILFGS